MIAKGELQRMLRSELSKLVSQKIGNFMRTSQSNFVLVLNIQVANLQKNRRRTEGRVTVIELLFPEKSSKEEYI
jgi:hypothetical protein